MTSIGALISIPVFCDSGYVIMNPLARAIARVKKYGYATLGIALAGGMVITHHFVPPTPGPLGVAGILGVNVGSVIITGLIFTVFIDRKSTRLNSSHVAISYAVFCLKTESHLSHD